MESGFSQVRLSSNRFKLNLLKALGVIVLGLLMGFGLVAAETADDLIDNPNLDTKPVREILGLTFNRGTWKYDCMECHRSIKARWHHDRPMTEHRDLNLSHGNNRFCLNCHHPENRNAYVDYDGSEIHRTDIVGLCGKCHGPQKRDWEAGVHGRVNGFWNHELGAKEKLLCIECHNPHNPAFKAMRPLAPPVYPERAAGHASHQKQGHKEAKE